MVYMDDIILFDTEIENHKKNPSETIRRLEENNFRINPAKIPYCKNEVKILEMIVDGKEKTPTEERRTKVIEAKRLTKISELRSFIGLVGWLRGFIENFAEKITNLTNGLKGKNK